MCGYSSRMRSGSTYLRLCTSPRSLWAMKSRIASEAMYQLRGMRISPRLSAYSRERSRILPARKRPADLPPIRPWLLRRVDDALRELVEVGDLEHLLGDVDELELVGEEAAHQRGAQPQLGGERQVALLDAAVAEALQRVDQLGERRVGALDGVLDEGGLLLADPALDAGDDLAVGQMLAGDAERGLGGLGVGEQLGPRQRAVLVERAARDSPPGPVERSRLLGLLDAPPAEVVDHAATRAGRAARDRSGAGTRG